MWYYAILLFYTTSSVMYGEASLIITTESGQIQGKLMEYNGSQYFSYQGIPYAEPPIGELRFKEPEAIKTWTGIKDATKEKSVCPQTVGTYNLDQMSEDCLYLNIFVPANAMNVSKKLSTLFWIYGGEFKSQAGNENVFGPQLLMQKDVIVVTLNFRMGALGFLSLDVANARGNNGLKDIVQALKWINKNIKHFSGEPECVTIAGQSSGSAMVHYLMLTELTTGLFQRAILESGSAIGFRFFTKNPVDQAFKLGKELGFETDNKTELLQFLMQANATNIVAAQESMGSQDKQKGFRPFTPFIPNAEKDFGDGRAFITEHPYTIINNSVVQNVPIILGFNQDDGIKMLPAILDNPAYIDYLNEDWQRCVPTNIPYSDDSCEKKTLANEIKNFYFGNETIRNETLVDFVKMITDTQFSHGIDYWLRMRQKSPSPNAFYYVFAFDGELNRAKIVSKLEWFPGAAHGDELGYLFLGDTTKPLIDSINATTKNMLETMLDLWTNFVKYGNPTPDGCAHTKWEPVQSGEMNYLRIDSPLRMSPSSPIRNRTMFWESIYNPLYSEIATLY